MAVTGINKSRFAQVIWKMLKAYADKIKQEVFFCFAIKLRSGDLDIHLHPVSFSCPSSSCL